VSASIAVFTLMRSEFGLDSRTAAEAADRFLDEMIGRATLGAAHAVAEIENWLTLTGYLPTEAQRMANTAFIQSAQRGLFVGVTNPNPFPRIRLFRRTR
jgi:hypothetical protein